MARVRIGGGKNFYQAFPWNLPSIIKKYAENKTRKKTGAIIQGKGGIII